MNVFHNNDQSTSAGRKRQGRKRGGEGKNIDEGGEGGGADCRSRPEFEKPLVFLPERRIGVGPAAEDYEARHRKGVGKDRRLALEKPLRRRTRLEERGGEPPRRWNITPRVRVESAAS